MLRPASHSKSGQIYGTWKNGSCHPEGKLFVVGGSAVIYDTKLNSSATGFLGNGYKLKLVISYTSDDLGFEPSISVRTLMVHCNLSLVPRNAPATSKKFRTPSRSYRVSYHGETARLDSRGNVEAMDPTRGIYKDPNWSGPTPSVTNNQAAKRMEYFMNIYIPIPVWIFATAETRAFDIEVKAWVSVASAFPVPLRTCEQVTFSHFVQINGRDDSKGCVLRS
jgi:hypothetical protein